MGNEHMGNSEDNKTAKYPSVGRGPKSDPILDGRLKVEIVPGAYENTHGPTLRPSLFAKVSIDVFKIV